MHARTHNGRLPLDVLRDVCRWQGRNFRAARLRRAFSSYLAD